MRSSTLWRVTCSLHLVACGDDVSVADGSADGSTTELEASDGPDAGTADGSGATSTPSSTDSGGPPGVCGNGEVEASEECDDGNTVGGDACYADCTLPYELQWQLSSSGATGFDQFSDAAIDDAGNVYAAGTTSTAAGDTDAILTKYTPDGRVAWTYTYAGTAGIDDAGAAVAFLDGDPVLGGHADDTALGILVRVSAADGGEVWLNETTAPDRIDSLAAQGEALLVGGADVTVMGSNAYVARVDASGAAAWETTFPGPSPIVAADAAGNVHAIVGDSYRRLDGAGDETLAVDLDFSAFALDVAADGRVVMAGAFQTFRCLGLCGEVRSYDADFVEQWSVRYDEGEGFETFYAVGILAAGDVVLLGEAAAEAEGQFDVLALRYSGDGTSLRWRYAFDSGAGDDQGLGLALSDTDDMVFVGRDSVTRTDARAFIALLTQGPLPR
jgi:cysteine-rich repeat protein